jgi:hypothetical protein
LWYRDSGLALFLPKIKIACTAFDEVSSITLLSRKFRFNWSPSFCPCMMRWGEERGGGEGGRQKVSHLIQTERQGRV